VIVAKPLGNDVVLIRVEGCDSLDTSNAEAVKRAALASIDGSADVVMDLSGVDLVDSMGVGVLVSVLKAARRVGGTSGSRGSHPRCARSSSS